MWLKTLKWNLIDNSQNHCLALFIPPNHTLPCWNDCWLLVMTGDNKQAMYLFMHMAICIAQIYFPKTWSCKYCRLLNIHNLIILYLLNRIKGLIWNKNSHGSICGCKFFQWMDSHKPKCWINHAWTTTIKMQQQITQF